MKQKEQKNNRLNWVLVVVLMALQLGLIGYMFYNNAELEKSKAFLEDEKVKISEDLDEMIAKYDKAIEDNSSISEELRLEREDIVLFRDSVKNLKQANYGVIRRYRRKIKLLEKANQQLFKTNDSLRISNQLLSNEIDSARVYIQTQAQKIDTLYIQNLGLIEKVGVGAKLKVNEIKAISMRERNNGKLVTTSRSKRTDALRISFVIAGNELADEGEETALIQILNPKGEVVHGIGKVTLKNGEEMTFTDKTSVDYKKEDIDVISLIEVNRKEMAKGRYIVRVFLDGRLVGVSKFSLR